MKGLPECEDAADLNDSNDVNITDVVILFRYLFLGTATPAAPFPACGKDETCDKLSCDVECG